MNQPFTNLYTGILSEPGQTSPSSFAWATKIFTRRVTKSMPRCEQHDGAATSKEKLKVSDIWSMWNTPKKLRISMDFTYLNFLFLGIVSIRQTSKMFPNTYLVKGCMYNIYIYIIRSWNANTKPNRFGSERIFPMDMVTGFKSFRGLSTDFHIASW